MHLLCGARLQQGTRKVGEYSIPLLAVCLVAFTLLAIPLAGFVYFRGWQARHGMFALSDQLQPLLETEARRPEAAARL